LKDRVNTDIIKIIEANLWIRKYFIEFSNGETSLDIIIGRNLNMFISRDTHIIRDDILLNDNKILKNKNSLNITRGHKIIIFTRN
jgi:hypothetical protein